MTRKWKRIAMEVYKPFAMRAGFITSDFSDESAVALFEFESFGTGSILQNNGFAQGKRLVDITVAMWIEDMYSHGLDTPPMLFASELYSDPNLPNWWLDKVIPMDRRAA